MMNRPMRDVVDRCVDPAKFALDEPKKTCLFGLLSAFYVLARNNEVCGAAPLFSKSPSGNFWSKGKRE